MQRQQRWIDYTGLNLIRIVIGSYFMAISLGLIDGSDPRVLFLPFLGAQTADLVTTVLLFAVTAAFMFGLFLRQTSLMLAIFMLASSYVSNFMLPEKVLIGAFWQDLTLVCAILLCYTCLKRNEVRKLHEELLIGSDMLTTPHPRILRAQENHLSEIEMANALQALRQAIDTRSDELLKQTLNQWIERQGDDVASSLSVNL